MGNIAINTYDLGKQYRYGYTIDLSRTFREFIMDLPVSLYKKTKRLIKDENNYKDFNIDKGPDIKHDKFWALKDINFSVNHGETVGIIGANGAGKSTLLKILSGITPPTVGSAEISGRIGSLLEVGTGFHPELTGKENIFLNGSIIGMKKNEIKKKFDEIVAFAEIENFLETPVKRYSSGMFVRLAFAIAAHLEPEILIVDEVLAVGDEQFQRKCLGKMEDVSKEGRTIIFVSHNMGSVQALCERTIVIHKSRIIEDNKSDHSITKYMSLIEKEIDNNTFIEFTSGYEPGNDSFKLNKIELVSDDGIAKSNFTPQENIQVKLTYKINDVLPGLRILLEIVTSSGDIAFKSTDHSERLQQFLQPGNYSSIAYIPGGLMNNKDYIIHISVHIPKLGILIKPTDYLRFSIIGQGNHGSIFPDESPWPGAVCPKLNWRINKI